MSKVGIPKLISTTTYEKEKVTMFQVIKISVEFVSTKSFQTFLIRSTDHFHPRNYQFFKFVELELFILKLAITMYGIYTHNVCLTSLIICI